MSDDVWLARNRAAWDERVPIHLASAFYDNPSFVAGRSSLRPFEPEELGPVPGRRLCHLQCHFGQDTLSWARLGARVAGLDFSAPAIDAARRLAVEVGLADRAEFVVADVYDAVAAFGGRRFDVVYAGPGAVVWLPDLPRWAEVIAELLLPGGVLYLVELHPIADVLDDDLCAVLDYFTHPGGDTGDASGTYADRDAPTVHNATQEWTHPVSSVVTALLGAGLRVELLHEHDFTVFPRWDFLERHDDFTWHLPDGYPRLPLMYSLVAKRPE
jgi:SAM-dependent methyltransferase